MFIKKVLGSCLGLRGVKINLMHVNVSIKLKALSELKIGLVYRRIVPVL